MQTLVISVPADASACIRSRMCSCAELCARADAAGVEQHVQRSRRLPAAVGEDAEPVRAADRLLVALGDREDGDVVVGPVPGPRREHLPGAGPVELLGVGEQGDRDLHGARVAA